MSSLDGYSIDKKIDKVRNELIQEINDLRSRFNNLYGYLQHMEESQKTIAPVKKEKKDGKNTKNRARA